MFTLPTISVNVNTDKKEQVSASLLFFDFKHPEVHNDNYDGLCRLLGIILELQFSKVIVSKGKIVTVKWRNLRETSLPHVQS